MVNAPEITLEANPGSVEMGRFRAFHQAGVNRVSLGVQALNDGALRALGRQHTKSEALKALETAHATFSRVSFDLIYARQFQTLEEWRAELTEALDLAGEHLSLYQLTIEDGTAFGKRAQLGKLGGLPDEDLGADMFGLTQDMISDAGFQAYEVSNHAKPGAESLHNMIYWRGGDYVGIGPGAHGRITSPSGRWATETPRNPNLWLKQVERNGTGESSRMTLTEEESRLEYLLMSLRTTEGMSIARHDAITGRPLPAARRKNLEELGLIEEADGQLRTTSSGRPLLNAILRDLCA
jgi:oxygen-independent coproporphyrinogen-3 oxidase